MVVFQGLKIGDTQMRIWSAFGAQTVHRPKFPTIVEAHERTKCLERISRARALQLRGGSWNAGKKVFAGWVC